MDLTRESIAEFKKRVASQPIYPSPKVTNNASSYTSQSTAQRSNIDLPQTSSKKKKQKQGKSYYL